MSLLRFTFGNAKLKGIYHYSLPSGYTCPGAKNCKTFADEHTGKIRDELYNTHEELLFEYWLRILNVVDFDFV